MINSSVNKCRLGRFVTQILKSIVIGGSSFKTNLRTRIKPKIILLTILILPNYPEEKIIAQKLVHLKTKLNSLVSLNWFLANETIVMYIIIIIIIIIAITTILIARGISAYPTTFRNFAILRDLWFSFHFNCGTLLLKNSIRETCY